MTRLRCSVWGGFQGGLVVLSGGLIAFGLPMHLGCGGLSSTEFPNALVGPGGSVILLDDVEAIAGNPDLTDDERRDELRALGIEDEELIDALLGL